MFAQNTGKHCSKKAFITFFEAVQRRVEKLDKKIIRIELDFFKTLWWVPPYKDIISYKKYRVALSCVMLKNGQKYLKILQCSHPKIFKVYLVIFSIIRESD